MHPGTEQQQVCAGGTVSDVLNPRRHRRRGGERAHLQESGLALLLWGLGSQKQGRGLGNVRRLA